MGPGMFDGLVTSIIILMVICFILGGIGCGVALWINSHLHVVVHRL